MKRRRQPELALGGPAPQFAAICRREVCLLVIVFVTGAALRLHALSRSAVEHFDEGVYASNIFFPPPDYAYPLQRFYAPPLVPALIETSLICGMIVGVPPNAAALVPGFIAGCATIVALWWFGRSWIGPPVGLAAAVLVALSPFHAAYSAAALTDVLLGLWLVLAVDAAARSVAGTNGDLRWAAAAGLFTGLAWWTKYNGWLPLAIVGTGLAALYVVQWAGTRGLAVGSRMAANFAVICLVGVLVWAPWWLALQRHGGYAPIAANHATYVVGLAGWLDAAARQVANFSVMTGSATAASFLLAVFAAGYFALRGGRVVADVWQLAILGVVGLLLAIAEPLLGMLALSASGLVVVLHRSLRETNPPVPAIGGVLLAAWWCGLLVATPCYWPYPRLLMPWLLASWLGAAILLAEIARLFVAPREADGPVARPEQPRFLLGLVGGSLLVVLVPSIYCRTSRELRSQLGGDRLSFMRITERIRSDLDSRAPAASRAGSAEVGRVVYVYGEPALFFQLCAAGESVVRPIQHLVTSPAALDGRPLPTFLAIGPHADREPAFRSAWAAAEQSWEFVAAYEFSSSPIVWLDLHNPLDGRDRMESAIRPRQSPPHAIQLYELRQQPE